jgi:hypothetical protein
VVNESMVSEVIKVEVPIAKSETVVASKKNSSNQNRDDIWNNVLSKINKVSLQQNLK